ncbi:MAG: hypothetical protein LBT14_05885 [Treponema sp.]|jgi:hypothetical protein|nr:hypothetical protein [Treponema sp.]
MDRFSFKKGVLIACTLCIILVSLFSVAFILTHIDHDCTGSNDCPVCLQIEGAQNLLKQLRTMAVVVPAAALAIPDIRSLGNPRFFSVYPITTITLKVRLNT